MRVRSLAAISPLPLSSESAFTRCPESLSPRRHAAAGKSTFGILLLRHLLHHSRNSSISTCTVIYSSASSRAAWLFRPVFRPTTVKPPQAAPAGSRSKARSSSSSSSVSAQSVQPRWEWTHDVTPFHRDGLHCRPELNSSHTVLICDGGSLPVRRAAASAVVIDPPQPQLKVGRRHRAHDADVLTFPPLTWPEMQAMRASCYPHVSEGELQQRFALVGGVPGLVFGRRSVKSLDAAVDRAVASLTTLVAPVRPRLTAAAAGKTAKGRKGRKGSASTGTHCLGALAARFDGEDDDVTGDDDSDDAGASDDSDTASMHRSGSLVLPVHTLPWGAVPTRLGGLSSSPRSDARYFHPAVRQFASREVAARVLTRLLRTAGAGDSVRALLAGDPKRLTDRDPLAALHRQLFLPAALLALSHGCELECYDMQTGAETTLRVPPSEPAAFGSYGELQQLLRADPQRLLAPSCGSATDIDAVLPGGRLACFVTDMCGSPGSSTASGSPSALLGSNIRSYASIARHGHGAAGASSLCASVPPETAARSEAEFAACASSGSDASSSIHLYWLVPKHTFADRNGTHGGSLRTMRFDGSFTPSFMLAIPEEQAARSREARLHSDMLWAAGRLQAAQKAEAASARTSTGTAAGSSAPSTPMSISIAAREHAAAAAALASFRASIEPQRAEWRRLQGRVKHFAVCMDFDRCDLRPPPSVSASASAPAAGCAAQLM